MNKYICGLLCSVLIFGYWTSTASAESEPQAFGKYRFPDNVANQIAEMIGTSEYCYYLYSPVDFTVEWQDSQAQIITKDHSYHMYCRTAEQKFHIVVEKSVTQQSFRLSSNDDIAETVNQLAGQYGGRMTNPETENTYYLTDKDTLSFNQPQWAWDVAHALQAYPNIRSEFYTVYLWDNNYISYDCPIEEFTKDGFAKGDFNGDTEISADDAQSVLKVYIDTLAGNTPSLLAAQMKAADFNSDGKIDCGDAQLILQEYVKKLSKTSAML